MRLTASLARDCFGGPAVCLRAQRDAPCIPDSLQSSRNISTCLSVKRIRLLVYVGAQLRREVGDGEDLQFLADSETGCL